MTCDDLPLRGGPLIKFPLEGAFSRISVLRRALTVLLIVVAFTDAFGQTGWRGGTASPLRYVTVSPVSGQIAIAYETAYQSPDRGRTWASWNPPGTPFASSSGDFFANANGLYRLRPGETNWTRVATMTFRFWAEDRTSQIQVGISGSSLYRSVDAGASWQLLRTNIPAANVEGLGVVDRDTILISDYWFQVFRTTNGAASFSVAEQKDGLPWSTPTALLGDIDDPDRLYVGSYWSGVYVSTNRGATWSASGTGLPEGRGVSTLKRSPDGGIYALVADQKGRVGLFRTRTKGETWEDFTAGLPLPQRNACSSWGFDGEGRVYAGFGPWGVWVKESDTNQWAHVNTGRPQGLPPSARCLAVDSSERLYCGVNGFDWGPHGGTGLFVSEDGGDSWFSHGEDYTDLDVNGLAADTNGFVYMSTYWMKIARSADGGRTWENPSEFRTQSSPTQLLHANGKIYAGTYWTGVHVTQDQARTWMHLTNGLPVDTNSPFLSRGVWSLALQCSNRVVCLGRDQMGVHGVYRLDSTGESWERQELGIPASALEMADALGTGGAGSVYLWGPGFLYRLAAESAEWMPATLPDGYRVLSVSPSPGGGTLAGTAQGGVYRRAETSEGWAKLGDSRLDGLRVQALCVGGYGTVYAGTDGGVFSYHPGEWIPAESLLRSIWTGEARDSLEILLFGYAGGTYEIIESDDLTSWGPAGSVKLGADRVMRWEMDIDRNVPSKFWIIRSW